MSSRYAGLSREALAALVPELLLIGQLIDRSAMAWCIQAFGREEMLQIAIEEWASSSPVYTRRMQQALRYEGDDVITIFKGLQFDIGAPPQFMDFRFTLQDRWHGEFQLDHCGALLDVEPMGPDYVIGMCHTIEDPTFDATAVATNPKAQVRPIHRPPRQPADRRPHCAWTVTIDDSHPDAEAIPALALVAASRAATLELDPIDDSRDGAADYRGPLLSDLDFAAFSHSALVRIADEVCLQMHLLAMGFAIAVRARSNSRRAEDGTDLAIDIRRRALTGIAGVAAERIHRALALPGGVTGALQVLALHPLFNPAAYVHAAFGPAEFSVSAGPAHDDEAWIALVGPGDGGVEAPGAYDDAFQAIVAAVDPCLRVELSGAGPNWSARVVETSTPARERPEVVVTKFSKGASFQFRPRSSLPLTVLS